jgi:sugar transferase EpsL
MILYTAPTPRAKTCEGDSRDDCVMRSKFGPREFFTEFLRELEQRGIEYAILHGYECFPEEIRSDVDYAVTDADLRKIRPLLSNFARKHGWVVVQTWQHEVSAFYSIVVDPENPANHIALDACSHFTKNRHFLVRDTVLLDKRRRHSRGFLIPSHSSEFIYLLAKALLTNRRSEDRLQRLRELYSHDPRGAEKRFRDLVGGTGCTLEKWLNASQDEWEKLGSMMRARNRYGLRFFAAEMCRIAKRSVKPDGLHIAVLGPDGVGKSTLLENLRRTLKPCFANQRIFKFRPDVFGQIEPGTNSTPHNRPPRSRFVSWMKIFFYFADWWIGWVLFLLPARRRGALLIFDRDFDDIVADQRRYLVQGVGKLTRFLRRVIPRADATYILHANSHRIHARKPELPIAELERQQQAYRWLASRSSRMRLICADQPATAVARTVSRDLILLLAAREQRRRIKFSKRVFDVAVATVMLVLLLPVLIVVALLVAWKLGTPILFRQTRPGLHGRPFTIYKFRTMTDARDASGRLLPDAERLTPFGKFLRSTSLDELLELLNVIRGDMSLVGPRPLLMDYLPLYNTEQMRRHDVLPGITGWAQINGRNAATWPRKFALDVWYVDHQSVWLDLKILALTVRTVLAREGISQPGWATADRFRGSEELEAEV